MHAPLLETQMKKGVQFYPNQHYLERALKRA